MDYIKIGDFIMNERKAKNLTQSKLAEILYVSDKTISKWENGRGVPDASLLPKLSGIFEVSINEILNGERISSDDYNNKAEQKLLELQSLREEKDKMLLSMEILIGVLSVIILLSFTFIASLINMETWIRITLIIAGLIIGIIGVGFALRIEQIAGYYECKKCNHKYIPTYNQVFLAMHAGRTRFMKCPHCKQKSWQKKVLK